MIGRSLAHRNQIAIRGMSRMARGPRRHYEVAGLRGRFPAANFRPMIPPPLTELFPDADFAFSMRMRPASPADFFQPSAAAAVIVLERRRWLEENPGACVLLDPAHAELVASLAEFAGHARPVDAAGARAFLMKLGGSWEPDFIVVSPAADEHFVLRAGCVCFPSGWAPEEKLGLPVQEIHGVVPGLNDAVGAKIHQFLGHLKPGPGWYRANWGISSSPELNQHPARGVNRLTGSTTPASTWLRIEHQMLTALPGSNAVLFGIRLQNVSLAQAKADGAIRAGLHRALATMPAAMADYKNLTAVRPALLEYLR